MFGGLLFVYACTVEAPPVTNTGGASGGPGSGASGSPTAQGGMAGAGGMVAAGANNPSAGAGGAASGTGGGGAAGTAGTVAGTAGQGGSSTGVPAGCANDPHPICLDFESGIDAKWTGGTEGAVSMQDKAHGMYSYHAYKGAGVLTTTQFGTISNVMWGRFYLRMTPGAPGGHGNIVGAYEGGDWYELGWQFNGLMGVWHFSNGENPLRSRPEIVDQWYCVELLFDGTKTEMPRWWVDGVEVEYYMGEPNNQKPHLIEQFDELTVGFTTYAGLGLAKEPYGNNNPPVLTDMWLDDIAFDVQRIGCIGQ
jgi:hypothetical protein